MDHETPSPRIALGCLVVILAVFICSGGITLVLDRVCNAYLTRYLQIYPNAEVIASQHNMIADFGIGTTVLTLEAEGDHNDVRAWHARTYGAFLRESLRSDDFIITVGRKLARVDWDVSPSVDGTGSQIILLSTCVN